MKCYSCDKEITKEELKDRKALQCIDCKDVYCKGCEDLNSCYSCGAEVCDGCARVLTDEEGDNFDFCYECYKGLINR